MAQTKIDLAVQSATGSFAVALIPDSEITLAKLSVDLSNVDNTTDAGKPVSTAQGTAIGLKANKISPAFSGTPTGISKAHVGLGSVDNESKASMFGSPTFTGSITSATIAMASSAKITGLGIGTLATDAINKGQLDAAIAGLKWKESVINSTTANITLSGEQTLDGILTSASRILVKDQTAGEDNGIYVTAAGAWARASDADSAAKVTGAAVFVEQGTTNANKAYTQTADSVTLGTTLLVWTTFSGLGGDSTTLNSYTDEQFMRSDVLETWGTAAGATLTLGSHASDIVNIAQGFSLGGTPINTTATELNAIGTRVIREVVATDGVDGVMPAFANTNVFAGSEEVFLNGLLQNDGGNDYDLVDATGIITFTFTPAITDVVLVNYRY